MPFKEWRKSAELRIASADHNDQLTFRGFIDAAENRCFKIVSSCSSYLFCKRATFIPRRARSSRNTEFNYEPILLVKLGTLSEISFLSGTRWRKDCCEATQSRRF